jgi:glycosyltransferase involved in cell wall biosynthesis
MKGRKHSQNDSCLLFITPALGSGGAERVITILANNFAQQGYKIILVSLNYTQPAYPVEQRVTVHYLVKRHNNNFFYRLYYAWLTGYRLLRLIREARPYRIISFITSANLWTGAICFFTRTGYLVSERASPQRVIAGHNYWYKRLLAFLYSKAEAVVLCSNGVADGLGKIKYFSRLNNVHVIPNPVSVFPAPSGKRVHQRKFILAVGRLAYVKGFDKLIDAFALLKNTDLDLLIVGDGGERNRLDEQCKRLGLEDRVFMPGEKKNVQDYYVQAELFVLPSRSEGYPNALIEAMSFGCACIAVDCNYGPRDIITDGVNGLLVPPKDPEAIATAIYRMMKSPALKKKLGEQAQKINQTNSSASITSRWEDLIFNF